MKDLLVTQMCNLNQQTNALNADKTSYKDTGEI